MAAWYVFQHDGAHLGPLETEIVVERILGGTLSTEVWVAAPGGPRWLRAIDVPAIADLVASARAKPRESSLRVFAPAGDGSRPNFGATVMMVRDDELDTPSVAPVTERGLGEPAPTLPSAAAEPRNHGR